MSVGDQAARPASRPVFGEDAGRDERHGRPEPEDVLSGARYRRALLWLLGVAVVFAVWLAAGLGSDRLRQVVSDLVFIAAPGVAAWCCWGAHRARQARHRAWAWIGSGCVVWMAASVVWTCYELVLGDDAPFPSWADIGYIGYAVPMMIGVALFPCPRPTSWTRWRLRADAVLIAWSVLTASAIWVLEPVLAAPHGMGVTVIALGYPLAGVGVAAAVLARVMVFPASRRQVWLPLSVGLLVLAVTDSMYVASTITDLFATGELLDVGWLLSFGLVAVAARAPGAAEPAAGDKHAIVAPPTLGRQLVPTVAFAVAAAALISDAVLQGDLDVWLAVPLAVVVAGRELVVVADSVALSRSLADEVDRRTAQLAHREQWWRDILSHLTDVVIVVDPAGRVRYCTPSLAAAIGHWPDLRTAEEIATQVHADDLPRLAETIAPVVAGQARQGFVECRVQRADGSWAWFEVTAVGQVEEHALEGTVITLHDVSDRRELTDRLAHQAFHDMLTGLPNRAMLMEGLEQALTHREELPFALLLVDLDDFKVINDMHGHAAGDVVLEVIARRLAGAVREVDLVARLGGDEFALLIRGDGALVRATAARLVDAIVQPIVTGGRSFLVRASIGGVLPTDDEMESPPSLLSHADIALYEAKANDKGGIVIIDGPERYHAAQQVHLREQISQPDLDQFRVAYQPLVDLTTGAIRGVEALLRWEHPDLGNVPPDSFIPMAEHGGSIQRLGWFVLAEALAQLAHWDREHPEHRLSVGINVSVRQLDEPGFADNVLDMIDDFGLDPDQVTLELTEQSIAVDFETAVAVVAELRAGGVSVAVDDYGTGYSSLRYLHRFAADTVKIDRSFIRHLCESVHTQKIVAAVLDMADSLGLQAVAEGIETAEQLALVRELGCGLGQGYLFSRPVTPAEIDALLHAEADRWRRRTARV